MTAYYNAPDDAGDLVASFHSLGEAQEYVDEYGGEIGRTGVVFTVGRGADHERAKSDAAKAARGEPRTPVWAAPESQPERPQDVSSAPQDAPQGESFGDQGDRF